jgi:PAS domain S-box-containing protein
LIQDLGIANQYIQLLEEIAPVIIYSDKGTLTYSNSLFKRILQYEGSTDKQLHFDRLVVNKSLNDIMAKLENSQPWWEEMLILSGGDKQLWFRAKIIPLSQEKGFVMSLVEHQGEEQSATDESTLAAINRNLSEGLYRSTEYGKLIYTNEAFVEMFGYDSASEVKSLAAEAFYVEPKKRMELIGRLEADGNFVNKEVLLKRKNGEVFWGLLSTSKTIDESGQAVYDGALRDITGFKEIERQLKIEKRKAEEASSAKEQFLSTMSHELRTPMNAVIGMTHLLLKDDPKEGQIENLKTLRFSAENLMHIINRSWKDRIGESAF